MGPVRSHGGPRLGLFAGGWLAVTGCAGYTVHLSEPPPSLMAHDAPDLARVCLVRRTAIGAALVAPIRDNGLTVGATDGPSWFCWFAGAGLHTLTTEVSDAPALELRVLAGEDRLVEHEINLGQDALVELRVEPHEARPQDAMTLAAQLAGPRRYATIDGMATTATAPATVVPGLRTQR